MYRRPKKERKKRTQIEIQGIEKYKYERKETKRIGQSRWVEEQPVGLDL